MKVSAPSNNISVVIITLNEEKNIARCIKSAQLLSTDVVLVDSGSSDRTVQIAHEMGARVFIKNWEGYAIQKNFGNEKAVNNLILSLDADEEISKEAAVNIQKALEKNNYNVNVSLNILSNFEGKFIYHGGWYPDWHLRIFNKANTTWSNDLVHERLVHNTVLPTVKVQGDILHYTAETRDFFSKKMDRYAFLYAENKVVKGVVYNPAKKIYSSMFRFVKEFIFKLGFMDGNAGFNIAYQNARYTFLKYYYMEYLRKVALTNQN